jgi:hypothetical protein
VQEVIEARMLSDAHELVIVESRTAQAGMIEVEPERVNHVQTTSGIRAEAYDIACIRRDFRLK